MDAGWNSPALRDFASLNPPEAAFYSDYMLEVLASLGVPVTPGVSLVEQLPVVTDFGERCQRALELVDADGPPYVWAARSAPDVRVHAERSAAVWIGARPRSQPARRRHATVSLDVGPRATKVKTSADVGGDVAYAMSLVPRPDPRHEQG
jgi:hypothetical protein